MYSFPKSLVILALLLSAAVCSAGEPPAPQSTINPAATQTQKYPKVVLFSTSWCPHCKEAKEYFTKNNIPFINRDVELDPSAMEMLTGKYKSQGVPVLVLGDDKVIIKGFSKERFEKAVQDLKK
jgi:glutaredoxin-like YruB-family protein